LKHWLFWGRRGKGQIVSVRGLHALAEKRREKKSLLLPNRPSKAERREKKEGLVKMEKKEHKSHHKGWREASRTWEVPFGKGTHS